MATPDISKLVQLLDERRKKVFSTTDFIRNQNRSDWFEQFSSIVRKDQEIKHELDKIQLEIANQKNSDVMLLECVSTENINKFLEMLDTANYWANGIGLVAGSAEHYIYVKKKPFTKNGLSWRGKNGVWYSTELNPRFYGNQFTGKRAKIINNNLGKLGNGLFWLSTTYSGIKLVHGLYTKNDYEIFKSSLDITVGCIAAYGGPPGWIIGGIYLMLDLGGAFDYENLRGVIRNNNPYNIAPRDKTYVAPKHLSNIRILKNR